MQKIVFESKMLSLKEFLDDTDSVELQLYLENISYTDKVQWETARFISYYTLLPNLKKGSRKTMTDIFPLVTDKESLYKLEQKFDESDYENTKEKLDKIKNSLNLEQILKKDGNVG